MRAVSAGPVLAAIRLIVLQLFCWNVLGFRGRVRGLPNRDVFISTWSSRVGRMHIVRCRFVPGSESWHVMPGMPPEHVRVRDWHHRVHPVSSKFESASWIHATERVLL